MKKTLLLSVLLPISFVAQALPVFKTTKKADQAVTAVKSNAGKIVTATMIAGVAGLMACDNKEAIKETIVAMVKNPPSLSTFVVGIAAVPAAACAYTGAIAIKEFFVGTDGGFRLLGAAQLSVISGLVCAAILTPVLDIQYEEASQILIKSIKLR